MTDRDTTRSADPACPRTDRQVGHVGRRGHEAATHDGRLRR